MLPPHVKPLVIKKSLHEQNQHQQMITDALDSIQRVLLYQGAYALPHSSQASYEKSTALTLNADCWCLIASFLFTKDHPIYKACAAPIKALEEPRNELAATVFREALSRTVNEAIDNITTRATGREKRCMAGPQEIMSMEEDTEEGYDSDEDESSTTLCGHFCSGNDFNFDPLAFFSDLSMQQRPAKQPRHGFN